MYNIYKGLDVRKDYLRGRIIDYESAINIFNNRIYNFTGDFRKTQTDSYKTQMDDCRTELIKIQAEEEFNAFLASVS